MSTIAEVRAKLDQIAPLDAALRDAQDAAVETALELEAAQSAATAASAAVEAARAAERQGVDELVTLAKGLLSN